MINCCAILLNPSRALNCSRDKIYDFFSNSCTIILYTYNNNISVGINVIIYSKTIVSTIKYIIIRCSKIVLAQHFFTSGTKTEIFEFRSTVRH